MEIVEIHDRGFATFGRITMERGLAWYVTPKCYARVVDTNC